MKKKTFIIFDIIIDYIIKLESGMSEYAMIYAYAEEGKPVKGELIFIKEPIYTALYNYEKAMNRCDTIDNSYNPEDIHVIILYMDKLGGHQHRTEHRSISKSDFSKILDISEEALDEVMAF